MEEKIKRIKAVIAEDEEKAIKLQSKIRANKAKLKEAEESQILGTINGIEASGKDVIAILKAIENGDKQALMQLCTNTTNAIVIDKKEDDIICEN